MVIPTNPSQSVIAISAPWTRKPSLTDRSSDICRHVAQLHSEKSSLDLKCVALSFHLFSPLFCFLISLPCFLTSHPFSFSPSSLYFFCLSWPHNTISTWYGVLVVVLRSLLCLALRNQSHHSQERLSVQHPAPAL